MRCDLCLEDIDESNMYTVHKYYSSKLYPMMSIHIDCWRKSFAIIRHMFTVFQSKENTPV